MDDQRKPVPVPPLRPSTPNERRRHAAAIVRKEMRIEQEKRFAALESIHRPCFFSTSRLRRAGDTLYPREPVRQATSLKDVSCLCCCPQQRRQSGTAYTPILAIQLARFDGRKCQLFGQVDRAVLLLPGGFDPVFTQLVVQRLLRQVQRLRRLGDDALVLPECVLYQLTLERVDPRRQTCGVGGRRRSRRWRRLRSRCLLRCPAPADPQSSAVPAHCQASRLPSTCAVAPGSMSVEADRTAHWPSCEVLQQHGDVLPAIAQRRACRSVTTLSR